MASGDATHAVPVQMGQDLRLCMGRGRFSGLDNVLLLAELSLEDRDRPPAEVRDVLAAIGVRVLAVLSCQVIIHVTSGAAAEVAARIRAGVRLGLPHRLAAGAMLPPVAAVRQLLLASITPDGAVAQIGKG